MDKVKISIVVPVYNAEDYLDRCLHSILDQEFSSYEVILVDDGSTDASSLICDRYSSTDPRFVTLHQPNKGVSAARNAGINMANMSCSLMPMMHFCLMRLKTWWIL